MWAYLTFTFARNDDSYSDTLILLHVIRGAARNLLRWRDKPGGLEDVSPQRGPKAEYGNPREHQRGRNKKWPTVTGACTHHVPPLATPLVVIRSNVTLSVKIILCCRRRLSYYRPWRIHRLCDDAKLPMMNYLRSRVEWRRRRIHADRSCSPSPRSPRSGSHEGCSSWRKQKTPSPPVHDGTIEALHNGCQNRVYMSRSLYVSSNALDFIKAEWSIW